jgi:hypothetical protein
LNEIANSHLWIGDRNWVVFPPKQDPVMHAAGGMVTSPADMARWLSAHLQHQARGIPSAIFTAAHARQVEAKTQAEGVFDCEAYSLGWHFCSVAGIKFMGHGGAYTGNRSTMAFAPEMGVGFAVMANSETMTGGLGARLVKVFFEALAAPDASAPPPEASAAAYADQVRKQRERRAKDVADTRAKPDWSAWSWHPRSDDLKVFEGRYVNPQLVPMLVQRKDGRLVATLGVTQIELEPAAPNLFGATTNSLEPPAPFKFEQGGDGVTALTWQDRRYQRAD